MIFLYNFNVYSVVFLVMSLISCNKEQIVQDNPYLPNRSFSYSINMSLPAYSNLQFPGNYLEDRLQGRGINGVLIYNLNSSQYMAFELTEPNMPISSCSNLQVSGLEAISNCNGKIRKYSIITGQLIEGEGEQQYGLLPYIIRREGTLLYISN